MFKFEMNEEVYTKLAHFKGTITARTEYNNGAPNLYSVHHLDATGDPVYRWFEEQDLVQ